MPQKPRVVVIDDEQSICSLLARLLEREGCEVFTAFNGAEGLNLIEKHTPQILILDLNLPDIPGNKICAQLRSEVSTRHLPILILTGRNMEDTLANSLDGGADDYISKPFNNSELLARVRALLRRSPQIAATESIVECGALRMDILTRQVKFRGRLLPPFSPKEFGMLKQLVLQSPKVVSKESLALLVWNMTASQMNPRTLDVHMRRIRMKLGPAASCLRTVPRVGFQWVSAKK